MNKQPAAYVPQRKRNGYLYQDLTSNLAKRIRESKNNVAESQEWTPK